MMTIGSVDMVQLPENMTYRVQHTAKLCCRQHVSQDNVGLSTS